MACSAAERTPRKGLMARIGRPAPGNFGVQFGVKLAQGQQVFKARLGDDDGAKLGELIEALEENDEVQAVYTNAE